MAKGTEQEVHLTLEFACCVCLEPVSVTVRCRGMRSEDETENATAVAFTSVPCPACGQVNQLFFDAMGSIRSVKPFRCFRPLPVPSIN